jgi:integrase
MARPRRGTLRRRQTTQGVSYTVQFSYRGEEHYVYLGGSWEGWTEQRAVAEHGYLMAKVNRGEWTPAPHEPLSGPAEPAPSFQLVASEWLHRHQLKAGDPDGRSKTIRDLRWRLSVVIDKFGPVPADRVDYALADELVTELCEERLAIERARELGAPLMRTQLNSRTGRRYQARRRGLSNTSIRRALDASERVLRDAKKRGVIAGELADLTSAAPKAERPRRSFLELEQIDALLRAAALAEAAHRGLTWEKVARIRSSDASAVALARELGVSDTLIGKVRRRELWNERAEPRNRHDVPRRIVVETLILAGPRISEFCGLSAHHLDLAAGRLRVPRDVTKTDAGERIIPLVPVLREHLTDHRLDFPSAGGEPAFPTRNRTRPHPDNVRARILAPLRERANDLLEAEGRVPIAHMTPHTLRRTFASILAACDVPPRRAMYLMGHTDPTLTLAVYQQVLDMGRGSVELLEGMLGCTLAEARAIYNGETVATGVSVLNPCPVTTTLSTPSGSSDAEG